MLIFSARFDEEVSSQDGVMRGFMQL